MKSADHAVGSRCLALLYLTAKRAVISAGYDDEIAWQERACAEPITERRFLTEAAWVVLSSGMKEAVIRGLFPRVAAAFGDFVSAEVAALSIETGGRSRALAVFGHGRKIDAIIEIVRQVQVTGIERIRRCICSEGPDYLRTLPYLGPATALHLAKNLGQNVAKPDRHLIRIAAACGYAEPQTMCQLIHERLGEPIPVIDIVLWRYATLRADYLEVLRTAAATDPAAIRLSEAKHPSSPMVHQCQLVRDPMATLS